MAKKRNKITIDTKKVSFEENSDSEDFDIKNSEDEFISLSEDDYLENNRRRNNKRGKNILSEDSEEETVTKEKIKGNKTNKENDFKKISWGKEKRNYYQEKDEESLSEDEDEEDRLERLKEAIYLNQKEKEKLKETDFDLRNIYLNGQKEKEENDDNEEDTQDSMEKHKNVINKLITSMNNDLNKEKQNMVLELNEEQEKEAEELIMDEQEEYKILLTDLSTNIAKVNKEINENKELFQMKNIDEKNINPSDINKNTLLYLKKKNETLLTYIIYVTYYIFLKVMNSYNYNHPILEKLIYMNTLLAKVNELDPKIKFKISQLNNSEVNIKEKEETGDTKITKKKNLKKDTDLEQDTDMSAENEDEEDEEGEEENDLGEVTEEDGENEQTGKNAKYRVKKSLITEYTDSHIREKEKEQKKKNKEKIRNEKDVFIKELKSIASEKPEMIKDNYLKKIEKKLYAFDNKLSKKEMKKLMNKSKKNDMHNVGLSTNDLLKFVELPEMNKQNNKTNFEEKKIFRSNINKLKQMKKNELTKNMAGDDYVTYKKIDKDKLMKRQNKYEQIQGRGEEKERKNKRVSLDIHEIKDDEIQNMLEFKKQKKEQRRKMNEERNKEIRKKLVDEENQEVENRRKPDIGIIKNKGLIKKKKSKISSSRAKYRQKYAKKMKAYSGQHTKLREHDDNYSGEQRGINPNIKKSMDIK